ncbi:MAG: VTT domain-containing protein [Syntrophomonas sp.]
MTYLLFFFQAAVPVIPYPIVAGAAGIVFGRLEGFFLAYLGAVSGAVALFLLSRRISGNRISNLIIEKYHFDFQGMDQHKVFAVLLAARFMPVIPTPVINIGSAVSGVPFLTFFLSSAVGKILWAAVYVCLGQYLITSHNIKGTAAILGLIIILVAVGTAYLRTRVPIHRSNKD